MNSKEGYCQNGVDCDCSDASHKTCYKSNKEEQSLGSIYLCWGGSKVLIGCIFFIGNDCDRLVYDKPTIEKIRQGFFAEVDYDFIVMPPNKSITREYFDDLSERSHGMIQYGKSRIHASVTTDDDLKKFTDALCGKRSGWENMVVLKIK